MTLPVIIITQDVFPKISKITEERQAAATTNPGDYQLKTVVIIIIICKKMVAKTCSHNNHFVIIADDKACRDWSIRSWISGSVGTLTRV